MVFNLNIGRKQTAYCRTQLVIFNNHKNYRKTKFVCMFGSSIEDTFDVRG